MNPNVERARREDADVHMTRMVSPSSMHKSMMRTPSSAPQRPSSAATPATPFLREEEESSIHLTVSSPELDTSRREDAYMEQMSEPMEESSPEAEALQDALAEISIIEVDTPVTPPTAQRRQHRQAPNRRVQFDDSGVATPGTMLIPSHAAAPPLFDIYSDTPGTLRNASDNTQTPLLVSRYPSRIAREAPHYLLYTRNIGSKGRSSYLQISKHPVVDDSELLHGGRCRITFQPDLESLDPPPLGVISIPHAVLPTKPAVREERSGMLVVDPVYVVPPSRALTLVLPPLRPDLLLDHFVIHLVNGSASPVVGIAIAKRVLASLLHVNRTELKFYDVPVDEGVTISLVLHVHRIRNDVANQRLLASLERVDWYVPSGIEDMLRFHPERPAQTRPSPLRQQRYQRQDPEQTPMNTGFAQSGSGSEEEERGDSVWSDEDGGDDAEIEQQYVASAITIKDMARPQTLKGNWRLDPY
jgi:hypothetical protein